MTSDPTQSFDDRRREKRHEITLDVNYRHGDTYLYSRSSNLSEMGLFLVTRAPLAKGTTLELHFNVPGEVQPIEVSGEVVWVEKADASSEPGMGIRFNDPSEETRQRVKTLIRTMAYLD